MRKSESKTRRIMLSQRGSTYYAKCRESWTCNPLSQFDGMDIWAYIFSNDIKYLSLYDSPYGDRERIRNELTFMCCGKSMYNGLLEQYKFLYPDIMNKLQERYGAINME